MDEERQQTEQEAQGGGCRCLPGLVDVPVAHNPYTEEELLGFEQQLAEIDAADLAYFMRAPQG